MASALSEDAPPTVTPGELSADAKVWTTPGGILQGELDASVVFAIGELRRGGWNRVEYLDDATGEWRFGWLGPVADLRTLAPGACPRADAAHVLGLEAPAALRCFGHAELDLTPVYLAPHPISGEAQIGTPDWLARQPETVAFVHPGGDAGATAVHRDPEIDDRSVLEGWYSVRGHFDDDRASTCVRTPKPPFAPESPGEQRLWCQQQLVLTSVLPTAPPSVFR